MKRAARTDANQTEIIKAFRRMGAVVLPTHQLKNAFDCLVAFQGRLYIVEIKDGNKPPSARKLTEGELLCKSKFESVGVKYNVVESIDDAIKLLNR